MVLRVNGQDREITADPGRNLLEVLRDDLDMTGTKYGCGEGQCGACTVLVDGVPVKSCLRTVASVAGQEITTIEGLTPEGHLHPVQQSFLDQDAFQCGYCTPGIILAAAALLRTNPRPERQEIIEALDDHVCRCGCYTRILAAVEQAAQNGPGGER
jgi:aerobic-type carbon monoxide dehydrogenase small subunit (CoxS/CutS family)